VIDLDEIVIVTDGQWPDCRPALARVLEASDV